MQVGSGKGGKGEAGGSPTRMEQGFVMPATVSAYDESLYHSAQQTMPVPPSTPSNSSRNQGKGSTGTPEQEAANGQAGMKGMPPMSMGKGGSNMQEGSGFGSFHWMLWDAHIAFQRLRMQSWFAIINGRERTV